MKRSLTYLAGLLAITLLGGCVSLAEPADPKKMVVATTASACAYSQRLHVAMCVRLVEGGEETNPWMRSQVSNNDLKAALTDSMSSAGLIAAPHSCKHSVDVNLLGLSLGSERGRDELTSHANYKVYDSASQPILLETVSVSFTATSSDVLSGIKRLKLLNEGAMRASIKRFLDKLCEVR